MAWLSRGARGDNVERIQGLLYQAGMYDGRIDGAFMGKTEQAVKDWQTYIGALSDGRWGPKTMANTAELLAQMNDPAALDRGHPPVIPNPGSFL